MKIIINILQRIKHKNAMFPKEIDKHLTDCEHGLPAVNR